MSSPAGSERWHTPVTSRRNSPAHSGPDPSDSSRSQQEAGPRYARVAFFIPFRGPRPEADVAAYTVFPSSDRDDIIREELIMFDADSGLDDYLRAVYPTIEYIEVGFYPFLGNVYWIDDLESETMRALRGGRIREDVKSALAVLWPLRMRCDFSLRLGDRGTELVTQTVQHMFCNIGPDGSLQGTIRTDRSGIFGPESENYVTWRPGVERDVAHLAAQTTGRTHAAEVREGAEPVNDLPGIAARNQGPDQGQGQIVGQSSCYGWPMMFDR